MSARISTVNATICYRKPSRSATIFFMPVVIQKMYDRLPKYCFFYKERVFTTVADVDLTINDLFS